MVLLEIEGRARAYPIQILMWHEIVNDILADVPVAVTFCPLCNTAIAFERRIDDKVTTFGTTGRLRYSNLVMYDRTEEPSAVVPPPVPETTDVNVAYDFTISLCQSTDELGGDPTA